MYNNKNYLRIHHGDPCAITFAGRKTKKKKDGTQYDAVVVTFERITDGALIDATFKLPVNEFAAKTIAKIKKAAGLADGEKLESSVGKQLTVTVRRTEYNGKPMYNPSDFAPVQYSTGGEDVGQGEDLPF
jgi:hypothetical protein